MTMMQPIAVALWLATACIPVSAAEPITGRWAANPAGCGGLGASPALVVTGDAVRWQQESCRIARMYKAGNTVHIQAQCWGARGARTVPVSLRPHRGRLQLRWDRVAAGELGRCR